jgi:DNA-binding YbaB/EbfC family protein
MQEAGSAIGTASEDVASDRDSRSSDEENAVGQPNLQQLMQQAQKMQQQVVAAQAELAEATVTGTAGGGLVTVTMSGTGEVTGVKIDPAAVDPNEVETLEDLVLAAFHNAAAEARTLAEQKMGPLASGLGGLGLGM